MSSSCLWGELKENPPFIALIPSRRPIDLPMPSSSGGGSSETTTPKMPSLGGGSFGKASISSEFSVRSGSSDRDSHIDSILKTIAKDSAATSQSLDYSVNDANSIRLAINKTSELDSSAGPLKKMSEKPNNQTAKVVNASAVPLSPSLIKCNILKGGWRGVELYMQFINLCLSHSSHRRGFRADQVDESTVPAISVQWRATAIIRICYFCLCGELIAVVFFL